jgi:hypothetical protein
MEKIKDILKVVIYLLTAILLLICIIQITDKGIRIGNNTAPDKIKVEAEVTDIIELRKLRKR